MGSSLMGRLLHVRSEPYVSATYRTRTTVPRPRGKTYPFEPARDEFPRDAWPGLGRWG